MSRAWIAALLVLLCGLVVGVRSVGFERVVDRKAGAVFLAMDDAQYHARRAAHTAARFPEVLWFDPYLNHPRGAFVPWPPLYDWALGAAGRALGDLDLVLAWAPVALGLATALAVFAVARRLGGPGVGLGALAVFALLPASSRYTSVGNPDHHAVVALLATALLAAHLAALERRAWQLALVALRVAMLLAWHGSILYVVLPEAIAIAVAAGLARPGALRGQAAGCAAAALLGFCALALPHASYGGAWSAVELSLLQPGAYLALACVALAGAVWGAGATSAPGRLVRVGAAGALAGAVLAALAWDSLALGWAYASRSESFIAFNYEAQPLWRGGLGAFVDLYGLGGLLLPVTPLAGLAVARGGARRAEGLFFAAWTAALAVLAVSNARYGSDFAPAAAVALALLLAPAVRATADRVPPGGLVVKATASAVLVGLAFFATGQHLAPHASRSLATLRGARVIVQRPAQGFARSVHAFVDAVREATPETAGWDDPSQRPAYGVVTPPTLGFIVNARARRATPAGNFGPYVGREGIEATNRFYLAKNELGAMLAVRDLQVRYVITSDEGRAPTRLWHRLHHDDASARGSLPGLKHFRLVTESREPGVPLGALRGAAPDYVDVPYKLFEIVRGALLEVPGAPGDVARAEVEVETPAGRRFTWRTHGAVDETGVAGLRVPYATSPAPRSGLARATGPYRVASGQGEWRVAVSETAVTTGGSVALGPEAAPPR